MNRFRIGLLSTMSALIAIWLLVSVERAAAQRAQDHRLTSAEAAISANTNAITAINGRLDHITYIAQMARDDVKDLRNALWALAAALLLSFLTQVVQIKKDRGRA